MGLSMTDSPLLSTLMVALPKEWVPMDRFESAVIFTITVPVLNRLPDVGEKLIWFGLFVDAVQVALCEPMFKVNGRS